MFIRVRRFLSQFFRKSGTVNNEPLNKVSLIVIILIDIFILVNVFAGLDDISRWHISPSEAYPCYSDWKTHQTQTDENRDYNALRSSLTYSANSQFSFQSNYQSAEVGHLGKVSATCLKYASYKDKINNSANQALLKIIEQKNASIDGLTQKNRTIQAQYDSTLLEKIAGQPQERSINLVGAEKAKQEIDTNNLKIAALKKDVFVLKNQLLEKPESTNFLNFLKDKDSFNEVEKAYQKAFFWYPSIQFALQTLFLLPLILSALFIHRFAQRKGYGLAALMSWHLLVIFCIPLLFKLFEFLQVGILFQFIADIVSALFGGLLFLVSYLYILLIPLFGFGIIKFFQKFVFNAKLQAANRVQKSRCVRCAKKIRPQDPYCPHCGYYQYIECPNCHEFTYKHLPHCKHCGYVQDVESV
ncbi:MAG: hypothetical protein DCF22_19760 [Leptolyngbya sp.]|nr:MAG: hypothetical protein DCF22_19760 [Leptolyngbya sp.]